ncbi:MAG TPA: hypothetical protein VKH41_06825 [Myxococcota bacterium]|nr:hypothetical protein [Myxococcota bacterium]
MHPSRPGCGTGRIGAVRPSRRLLLALLSLVFALSAQAEGEDTDELVRWVPSLGVYFDMLGQKAEGSITPGAVIETPAINCGITNQDLFGCPAAQTDITTATASSDTSVASLVVGSLELMTPRLLDRFLSPRLFVRGDAAAAFAFERNLAGERKPGPFFTDPLKPTENDVFERSVGGQGSRAKFQVRPLVLGAGFGVAFTTTLFDRTIRLKPSVEYLREEVDLIASVRRAVKLQDPTPDLSGFRLISLSASEEETLHGLGGGIELETDAGRLGPIMVSVFVNGRGYHFLGNLHHTLTDTNERGETASWYYDFDPWAWRAGIGARFRWLPD